MKSLKEIKKEIVQIEEQNKREDEEIAWKESKTRNLLLALTIYFILGFTLQVNNYLNPWINAFIPAVGFFIIIYALKFIKKLWEKFIYKEKLVKL